MDFCGRLRILRSMHLPAALHGVEATLVSISGLRRLRTAFGQAALSGSLRLANPGAVLTLLDGPVGSDPGFHVDWCRFWMLRRHMAFYASVHELARIYSLLRVVSAGALGRGPVHLLLSSAMSLGFSWDSNSCCFGLAWSACSLPDLQSFSVFLGGCLDAWENQGCW